MLSASVSVSVHACGCARTRCGLLPEWEKGKGRVRREGEWMEGKENKARIDKGENKGGDKDGNLSVDVEDKTRFECSWREGRPRKIEI